MPVMEIQKVTELPKTTIADGLYFIPVDEYPGGYYESQTSVFAKPYVSTSGPKAYVQVTDPDFKLIDTQQGTEEAGIFSSEFTGDQYELSYKFTPGLSTY